VKARADALTLRPKAKAKNLDTDRVHTGDSRATVHGHIEAEARNILQESEDSHREQRVNVKIHAPSSRRNMKRSLQRPLHATTANHGEPIGKSERPADLLDLEPDESQRHTDRA